MVEHPGQHDAPTPPQGRQFAQPAASKKSSTPLALGVIAAVLVLCCGGLALVGALSGKPNPAPKAAAANATDHSSSSSPSSSPTAAAAATVPVAAPPTSTPPVVATTAAPPALRTTNPAPKPNPTTKAPAPPPPQPVDLCGAPANPYGYTFCGGSYIYNPPGDICSYLSCIGNFWNGRGYIEQCQDGMFSKSGGIQGSCSYHHGDRRPLYSH